MWEEKRVNTIQIKNPSFNQLAKVIDHYRAVDGPLIEVLHRAQEIFGYLPPEVERFVADGLGVPIAQVHGVVTFYNFFRTQPQGKHVINVCLGTACHVKGAEHVVEILHEELGVELGETTEDMLFTVTAVRCVGACGLAPVMMVDNEVYGKLDRKKIKEILAKYRK